ncbi:LacI family DNA-binding transcriptional regulator [Buchananella hordeovulneris]|uniref:LacI family DNA-binding transcriptional regulator n=1 Tax=Buchananella hordeovulneris TaxID=52770 RepID=UPI000F5F4D7E|nr:LacI family DNA-binding transcriptional regulator [Buchananella hordeovulneris]MDO5081006.1 LacI family DNA-binding transcriptional regulator [Buchananella hordeovulneris]RRD51905.1 LacI family DNA-binding transcriptional regulator [Buchananella hordeovulneris]
MSRRIGLADIAKQAGVSTATVSRVLNGHQHVAEETRRAVLTAADLLGYERPETIAPTTNGVIGIILPELTNPIFPLYAQELASALTGTGFTPLLGTEFAGGISEDEYLTTFTTLNVAGLVFVSGRHADVSGDQSRYMRLLERGLPFVTINGLDPRIPAVNFSTDDTIGIRLALTHLRHLGHTHIALVTGPKRLVPSARKAAAFTQALATCLPEAPVRIEQSLYTLEGGANAATRALQAGATAIIASSDIMAIGAIQAANSLGLSVPEDVSVIGYDGSPLALHMRPGLTTVRQPVAAICRAAIAALREEIAGAEPSHGEFLFAPDLIVRGTTATAPRQEQNGKQN